MTGKLNYIDLFAGCGGLSLGLHNSGWNGLFAIEKSKDAFETLRYNLISNCKHFSWPSWLPIQNFDIKEVLINFRDQLESLQGKIDLVVGGPPCQGFSMAGQRNEDDERNQMINYYIKFIEIVKPKMVFFENVKGFTVSFNQKKRAKPFSENIKELLERMGYRVSGQIIDFSQYGVPQRRKRFILVGFLNEDPSTFFESLSEKSREFLKKNNIKRTPTIADAISDLLMKHGQGDSPDSNHFKAGVYGESNSSLQRYLRKGLRCKGKIADSHRFPNHHVDTVKVFMNVIENAPRNKRLDGEYKEKFNLKRRGAFLLDDKSICPTITSNPDDYIHYSEARILTVREYARIQTFPDWFEFKGKYTTGGERRVLEVPRYTQIGNAIPPLFGEQVGIVLKEMANVGGESEI
ncbi:DNA cytosine methyltransferase [Paenibacillus sp. GYB004]|uniref:DNA cytosine methyltransferase n=1 Tax=Paenibacillus sp. GYB004 TaxID=2994393 RepID=UPI002F9635F9